jgi:hypothetical protein
LRAELEAQKLSNARLQERLRLTHDLHDGLGGELVHMIASVEQGSEALTRPQVLSMLKLIRNDLRQSIDSNASAQVRVPATPQEWLAPCAAASTTCSRPWVCAATGSFRKAGASRPTRCNTWL